MRYFDITFKTTDGKEVKFKGASCVEYGEFDEELKKVDDEALSTHIFDCRCNLYHITGENLNATFFNNSVFCVQVDLYNV